MTDTPNLGLPVIDVLAQKHLIANDAFARLDALVMLAVLDRDLATPPGSPADGDRYLVKAPGAGLFAGHDGAIAHFDAGDWSFYAPHPGWLCFVIDEGLLLHWNDSAWVGIAGAIELQNLPKLGIGTTADATNPLSAKLNNALWTARTVAEGGDGDLRYKLSKESAAKTLSLLFQDNFSGRAEIGLTGDDDFHFKVSADGAAWTEAIRIAAATGRVTFPAQGVREVLTADRTYYVRSDGSDGNDGLSNTAGGAFATIQRGLDVVFGALDLAGHNVTIQAADGSYGNFQQLSPQVGAGDVTVQGNAAHPENVVVAATAAGINAVQVQNGAAVTLTGFEVRAASGSGIVATRGGIIKFSNLRFGAISGHQIRASDCGNAVATAGYVIVGGSSSQSHWNAVGNGLVRVQGQAITLLASQAFSPGFAWATTGGVIFCNGCTFTGTATGQTYQADTNGVIQIQGAALPGNTAGLASTGGQVI